MFDQIYQPAQVTSSPSVDCRDTECSRNGDSLMRLDFKRHSVLPGFGLTLGYTLLYLSLIVLIPLSALFLQIGVAAVGASSGRRSPNPRVVASYRLTFGASLDRARRSTRSSASSWPGRWCAIASRAASCIDAMVDLPFALPTAVSGIALTAIYAQNGWIGQYLEPLGIKAAFSPLGITIALTFIGLPFVVRTLQPALEDLDGEVGRSRRQPGRQSLADVPPRDRCRRVLPALLTGFALSFARALGEYGSVVFISGNMPMKTEITSLLIITKLEQYDYAGATAIAVVMLLASFVILLAINVLQWWTGRGYAEGSLSHG